MELGRAHLGVERYGSRAVVLEVIVLQLALARLVADPAVDRMIEGEQLQDRLAIGLHRVGIGEHAQSFRDRHVAGNLDPAASLDLHTADPAVARHRQLGMPAKVRDVEAVRERRLEDALIALDLDRLPVYENLGHARAPSCRDRLCSMNYSNSSRNLLRMPLVA